MGRTDETLEEADRLLAGIRGQICLTRQRQRDLQRSTVEDWIERLERAAEALRRLK